ncbi:MAG TPA: NfeD family protein [Prolixibacteraceae bacterium]|nr:NfeD family protein [Prolixibacteraceae bacterium]
MSILVILLLIFLGIVLLLIEFTILPGITIAGIGGVLLFGYSIYMAFTTFGPLAGFLTLGFVVVVAPLLVVWLFQGRAGKRLVLSTTITGIANQVDEKVKVGDIGVTIGRLAPMGKIRVNGEVVEVKTTGVFIDPGESVRIIQIEKSQITVEPLNL